MRDVIARIVDGSRFREFKKEYGSTIVTVCEFYKAYKVMVDHEPRDLLISTDINVESSLIMGFYSLQAH
jgi:hypothetical protein